MSNQPPDGEPMVKMTLRLPLSFRNTLKVEAIHAGQTLQEYALETLCRRGNHAAEREPEPAGDGGTS